MESLSSQSQLLTHFSNCIWILPYYGRLPQCHQLMTSLCKSTHSLFSDFEEEGVNYHYAFVKQIRNANKLVQFKKGLTARVVDFLLNAHRYADYQLCFLDLQEEEIDILCEMILSCRYPQFLSFSHLHFELTEKVALVDKANYLLDLMHEKGIGWTEFTAFGGNFRWCYREKGPFAKLRYTKDLRLFKKHNVISVSKCQIVSIFGPDGSPQPERLYPLLSSDLGFSELHTEWFYLKSLLEEEKSKEAKVITSLQNITSLTLVSTNDELPPEDYDLLYSSLPNLHCLKLQIDILQVMSGNTSLLNFIQPNLSLQIGQYQYHLSVIRYSHKRERSCFRTHNVKLFILCDGEIKAFKAKEFYLSYLFGASMPHHKVSSRYVYVEIKYSMNTEISHIHDVGVEGAEQVLEDMKENGLSFTEGKQVLVMQSDCFKHLYGDKLAVFDLRNCKSISYSVGRFDAHTVDAIFSKISNAKHVIKVFLSLNISYPKDVSKLRELELLLHCPKVRVEEIKLEGDAIKLNFMKREDRQRFYNVLVQFKHVRSLLYTKVSKHDYDIGLRNLTPQRFSDYEKAIAYAILGTKRPKISDTVLNEIEVEEIE